MKTPDISEPQSNGSEERTRSKAEATGSQNSFPPIASSGKFFILSAEDSEWLSKKLNSRDSGLGQYMCMWERDALMKTRI